MWYTRDGEKMATESTFSVSSVLECTRHSHLNTDGQGRRFPVVCVCVCEPTSHADKLFNREATFRLDVTFFPRADLQRQLLCPKE